MRTPLVLAFLALLCIACGPKPEDVDGGTPDQDAGCDLNAGDSFKGGTFLDAGTSVEWEQECSRPPASLTAGTSPGGLCTVAERCAQLSCTCVQNSKRFAARYCHDAQCQDQPTTCAVAVGAQSGLCQ